MLLCCVRVYCGYSNSRYSAILLCCVEIFVVTAAIVIVKRYCVVLEFIVFTATVDIVQWYCVLCGDYFGYVNSRYSAKLMCCVWSLLWLL